jgi:hypothetical protein
MGFGRVLVSDHEDREDQPTEHLVFEAVIEDAIEVVMGASLVVLTMAQIAWGKVDGLRVDLAAGRLAAVGH